MNKWYDSELITVQISQIMERGFLLYGEQQTTWIFLDLG